MTAPDRYHPEPLLAYVQAATGVAARDAEDALARAHSAGLRVHRFKRGALPRVGKAIGLLRGLWPSELLDVGSGRGAFLWPLLHELPGLAVTSLEACSRRAEQLAAVARGGVWRLRALQGDVCAAPFRGEAFDGVTALEVLEHLVDPARAARELLRVARRFVLVSVPSKPDDNPEHLRCFTPAELEDLFLSAGARRVQLHHVLNHRLALVTK